MSFNREVLALVMNPALLDEPRTPELFSEDSVARARQYVAHMGQPLGAYSDSKGLMVVRQEVADFLGRRDDTAPGDPNNIFLTNGASDGVKMVMSLLLRGLDFKDGLLVPIPQYPLYSATTTLLNGVLVPYYLNEESGWGLDLESLETALADARKDGVTVRALAVINPGNPTGNCLARENMVSVARFCAREGLVLMADEVYQENVYGAEPFRSFRRIAHEEGLLGDDADDAGGEKGLQLVSFHSLSKVTDPSSLPPS